MIDMTETAAQRDAERVREHAPKLLAALQRALNVLDATGAQAESNAAREAIEYATGAHDPASYPEVTP